MYQRGVQNTLQAGSIIFGLSAIFLLIAPGLFLELLKLPTTSELIWAMRMIGITLVALSGNMWQNSKLTNAAGIKFVACPWPIYNLYSSRACPIYYFLCGNWFRFCPVLSNKPNSKVVLTYTFSPIVKAWVNRRGWLR
jgi:hypothetical protein